MYHVRLKGNHYEIGYHWGSLLASRGNYILNNIPFTITEDRIHFSKQCIPIYKEYFPDILNEIQGLADGQKCSVDDLYTVLFSMYAMPPACNCSCFAVSNGENIFFGRNSDFLTELRKSNMNVIYYFSGISYDFVGNTTSFIEIEDGVNEKGLAIGLTSVYPDKIKPGLNAGMMLRLFLEKCSLTNEVIELIYKIPISSAQTFTVADITGDIAVIEFNATKIEIIKPLENMPFVCATNVFHSEKMSLFNNDTIDNWQAEERYQTLINTLKNKASTMNIDNAKELLSGKDGFLCQYDRKTGKDTVWSVIYDLKKKQIYQVNGNPGRKKFNKDDRFLF